jgi:hypothetical protein
MPDALIRLEQHIDDYYRAAKIPAIPSTGYSFTSVLVGRAVRLRPISPLVRAWRDMPEQRKRIEKVLLERGIVIVKTHKLDRCRQPVFRIFSL